MEENINSWCVKITNENREDVKKFMNYKSMSYSIGAYYGIERDGSLSGKSSSERWTTYFSRLISDEEFYSIINGIVQFDIY
jgi:hypothetical protein